MRVFHLLNHELLIDQPRAALAAVKKMNVRLLSVFLCSRYLVICNGKVFSQTPGKRSISFSFSVCTFALQLICFAVFWRARKAVRWLLRLVRLTAVFHSIDVWFHMFLSASVSLLSCFMLFLLLDLNVSG